MGAAEAAVTESAEDLVSQSQDRTPVATGTLKGSQHVESVTVSGSEVQAKVATGGEAEAYAVYVHQGHGFHASAHEGPRMQDGSYGRVPGRPFMAQALLDNAAVYKEAIAAAARGAF
jgi:hypothetical protein